ncbi:DUF4179 domain-containing protein [Clostridium saccharoperbutylacetonicum]|uniref:DUF4179 domain-containing protein n=1 Tax=Clostridium saccharoperbutylacetonicum TaxID=36745 RepID=UPI000983F94E|nr:DUF4179 domain-containing protein [Clostridium saccharoperbutylacetonicum]AQR94485.1 hypothetical protein CLSAP_17940 [Clostridium saccharoperbutylacetonicum]NSB30319.1 hypothetical protein [Clostridium saccharoperbutylacetonicum]
MNNDIYSLFNDANINLDEYKKDDFNDIEKKLLKKNIRKAIKSSSKQSNRRKVIAAAAIVVLITGMSFGNTRAYALSKINLVSESISSFLGIEKNLEDYNTVVNKAITDNGVTVKLNEVILDDNELLISTNISSDKTLKENDFWNGDMSLYINNRKVKFTGASGGIEKIDNNTTQQVIEYDLDSIKDMDLSGDLNIKIIYSKMTVNYQDDINGTWKFEFKTNGDKLKIDTKTVKLDYGFELDNGSKYILEKYTGNSLGQKIYGKIIDNSANNESYNILLKGYDDLGNKVIFDLSRGRKDWFVLKYENVLVGNMNGKASKLILTPYAVKMPEHSGKEPGFDEYKKAGEEFTINIK